MDASLHYQDEWLSVWAGDCRAALRQMPERSVHAAVTSPPYFGLRDYGLPKSAWGGDALHAHDWSEESFTRGPAQTQGATSQRSGRSNVDAQRQRDRSMGQLCECGAWMGCLGLEPTPEMYVDHLVEVFREVRRVLRDDGLLWLNLGDSFARDPGKGVKFESKSDRTYLTNQQADEGNRGPEVPPGMKPLDLIGVPWMAAFALRADGWYLRQDIVWSKPNVMPESVETRPTRSHEFIFMLAKQPKYFYDHLAVKEPPTEATIKALKARMDKPIADKEYQHDSDSRMGKRSPNRVWSDPEAMKRLLAGRNMRDVWHVATSAFRGPHYAPWPPKLVEPMIKASTSEGGVCGACGAPYRRVTEDLGVVTTKGGEPHSTEYGRRTSDLLDDLGGEGETGSGFGITAQETVGWEPSCAHDGPTVPATVLDPFGGTGTTAMVAQQLSRRAILIDLNAEYIDLQMARNAQVALGL